MERIPTQVVTETAFYRDNRRGDLRVELEAGDLARIIIEVPGGMNAPPTTHTLLLAGAHLRSVIAELEACLVKVDEVAACLVKVDEVAA